MVLHLNPFKPPKIDMQILFIKAFSSFIKKIPFKQKYNEERCLKGRNENYGAYNRVKLIKY